jgi:Zn-dependent protease
MDLVRFAGIPIRIHWSLTLVTLIWALFTAVTLGPAVMLVQLLLLIGVFGSVVLHELGHAGAARLYGISTASVTLYPIGGVAAVARIPEIPVQELVIAVAGPAVNAVLFTLALVAWLATGSEVLLAGAAINLVMGVFNLIPAFPMDGGRVLRAGLSLLMGHVRASRVAMSVGKAFALAFFVIALVTARPSLLLLAVFLWFAIAMERRRLELWLRAHRPLRRAFSQPLL